jgi:hypothetical protein
MTLIPIVLLVAVVAVVAYQIFWNKKVTPVPGAPANPPDGPSDYVS